MTEQCDSALRINVDRHPAAVVIRVEGEVDLVTGDHLQTALQDGLTAASSSRPLVVDLRGVDFFGSTGLAELISVSRHADDHHVTLRIVATTPAVLHPITTTGLDTVLAIYPDLNMAIDAKP